jgi:hypothetical protein
MESEGTLKSYQTDLRKYDHIANSKYKCLHLPPLHEDVESMSRTTLFEPGGDDTGWPSDTTASYASTTSTLKSDIIESVIRYLGTPNLGKITSLSIFNEVSPSALFVGIASTHLVT